MCDCGIVTQMIDHLMNCSLLPANGNEDIFSVNTAAATWSENLPEV